MFDVSKLGSKPVRTRKKTARSYPNTQKVVAFLASKDLRVGYDTLSAIALGLGEAKPSGQSHGQRGCTVVRAFPLELQPMVCRGGKDEDRVGTYHAKPVAEWAEAGLAIREDLQELPVVRFHEADQVVEAFLATVAVDEETGEPIEEDAQDLS